MIGKCSGDLQSRRVLGGGLCRRLRQAWMVPWSLETLDDARRRLTAAIRNTFPADAKMED